MATPKFTSGANPTPFGPHGPGAPKPPPPPPATQFWFAKPKWEEHVADLNLAAQTVDDDLKSRGKYLGLPLDDEEVRLIALRLGVKAGNGDIERLRQIFTSAIESHHRARRK